MSIVCLDLDGVLQVNPFSKGVFPHVRQMLIPLLASGLGLSEEKASEQLSDWMRETFRSRIQSGDWVAAYDWDARVAEVATRAGYAEPIDVTALVQHYCGVEGCITQYPGADAALARLRQLGATVVAVTNGYRRYQEPVLKALGLWDYFHACVTPDTAGAAKPDPHIFAAGLAAAAAAGAPDSRFAMHVGDTLTHDIAGARRAGLWAVWACYDLPPELAAGAPWERMRHADFPAFLTRRLDDSLERSPADVSSVAEVQPDAVITSTTEIAVVYEHLQQIAKGD